MRPATINLWSAKKKTTAGIKVRETKASDYYLTITESKKFTNEDGSFYYKKHKIYVYKEDFENFSEFLNETMSFIFEQRGSEVISERHQKDYSPDRINSD